MSHFSFVSLKILSEILKRCVNLEILNMRCTREYNINNLHINKWDEGLKLVLNNCKNLKRLSLRCIYYYNHLLIFNSK